MSDPRPTEARLREALTDDVLDDVRGLSDELNVSRWMDDEGWSQALLIFQQAVRDVLIAAILPVMEEPDAVESRRPDEPPAGESYPEEG